MRIRRLKVLLYTYPSADTSCIHVALGPVQLLPYITPSCPATGHPTARQSGLAYARHAGVRHRGTPDKLHALRGTASAEPVEQVGLLLEWAVERRTSLEALVHHEPSR